MTRIEPGAIASALGAIAFFAVVLGPPAVAVCAIMSIAGIDVRPGGAGLHGFWGDVARQFDFLLK